MTPEAIAFFVAGLVQPFVQEFFVRNRIGGRTAAAVTIGVSFMLALVATWITGGLAGGSVPAFSLGDPSPLLGFLVGKFAPVYALSQLVFGLFNREIHSAAGTGL